MRMQLESLKIFCDVVRWSSFSRGATENGISQSSASQAVHQLEERLGVKLIDRSKRPLVLTPRGKVYYDGCRELVDRYLELENRVKAPGNHDSVAGTVGVAAIYSGLDYMSECVKQFEELNPRAKVRLEYLHPDQVLERVNSGEVELGLLSCPRKWPDLNVINWRQERMVLTVDPSHPLADRECVSVALLNGERFIAFDPELPIRRTIDRFLRRHDVRVDVVHEFDNIDYIKHAVRIHSGVSILPEPSLTQEIEAGTLVAIRIEGRDPNDRLTRPLALIHRRQSNLGVAAAKFLELLLKSDVTIDAPRPTKPSGRVPAGRSG
jgi:DNA-binding transcriptional LysR family regulator